MPSLSSNRNQRFLRPRSSAFWRESVVHLMPRERKGSGGKGSGFVWTIASRVRCVSRPERRSNMTWAANRLDPTPRPVKPAA